MWYGNGSWNPEKLRSWSNARRRTIDPSRDVAVDEDRRSQQLLGDLSAHSSVCLDRNCARDMWLDMNALDTLFGRMSRDMTSLLFRDSHVTLPRRAWTTESQSLRSVRCKSSIQIPGTFQNRGTRTRNVSRPNFTCNQHVLKGEHHYIKKSIDLQSQVLSTASGIAAD